MVWLLLIFVLVSLMWFNARLNALEGEGSKHRPLPKLNAELGEELRKGAWNRRSS